MPQVSIKPQWSIHDSVGQALSPRLLELLQHVQAHGSLSGACKAEGLSYRHAWSLIRQGEAQLGQPLLNMERGKGSSLTALGERLVWAGHRITARLSPMLETLASELEAELGKVMHIGQQVLRVHASHGFAIEKLIETLAAQGLRIERKYVGSQESVVSLHSGACELAGFHVPQGGFEARALAHYSRWLDPERSRLIHVATRRQGLMVAAGNPLKIYGVADLARTGLRFVNRQPSSGTRFLLECLLDQAGVAPEAVTGFNHSEFTHAAVAAYVASGMADVGLGVETPSRRFGLDFVPLVSERYFLLCDAEALDSPALQAVLSILCSADFRQSVDALPGYSAQDCGKVLTLAHAFPAPGA
jgi:molybdate transport repressor ModE-like protein